MIKKLLRVFLVAFLVFLLISVLTVIGAVYFVKNSAEYVAFDNLKLNDINSSLTILDNEGEVVDLPVYLNQSKQISLNTLPQHTVDAFVSVEDKRFFNHHGLDYKRILSASWNNILAKDFKEGASTISQQLIKNTHLNNSKTIKRKINEMLLTMELEANYPKTKILEMYLNTIYFGNSAYGIENASNLYFGKSAENLTLSESALLAGIIKSPNAYSPLNHYEKSMERRNVVLKTMLNNSFITEFQYQNAVNECISCIQNSKTTLYKTYSFGVIKEACKLLDMTPLQLVNSNLTISTFFDSKCQQALEKAVNLDNTLNLEKGKTNFTAVVSDNAQNGIKAFYCRGKANLFEKRQIGSTAKPFAVYAPALEKKQITTASLILDEPTNFGGYQPKNFNDRYFGWSTVKDAVANSMNMVSIKVLNSLGADTSVDFLKKMDFDVEEKQNLSMALGNINGGVNCLELLQGYETLANCGRTRKATFIKSICSPHAELFNANIKSTSVFTPQTAFLMTDMLQNAVSNGTAKTMGQMPFQVAAKTGTVGNENGNSDAILCGYTTQDTFVFWLSSDEMMANNVTGGTVPCKVAGGFLKEYYAKQRPKDFVAPENIIRMEIDRVELQVNQQIKIANQMTTQNDKESYYFEASNCPKEYSMRNIDKKLCLDVNASEKKVTINLPQNIGQVQLFKVLDNGEIIKLENDGKIYVDRDVEQGKTYLYYVEVYQGNKFLLKSKTYSVRIPVLDGQIEQPPPPKPSYPKDDNTKKDNSNPLNFWYIPIR